MKSFHPHSSVSAAAPVLQLEKQAQRSSEPNPGSHSQSLEEPGLEPGQLAPGPTIAAVPKVLVSGPLYTLGLDRGPQRAFRYVG